MRRATGSIVKHGKGWRVHATLHDQLGNARRVSRVVKGTRKEAEEVLREIMQGDYKPEPKTVSELCDLYLRHCRARVKNRELEPATLRGYESNISVHIIPKLGGAKVDKLTPARLRRFFDECETNRNAIFKTMRQIMRFAEEEELVDASPLAKVKAPKQRPPAVGKNDVYRAEEIAAIMAGEMPDYLRTAVAIALGCGLRRGEICGLDWTDYDGKRVHVSKAYGKEKPKTPNSVRSVSVPGFAREILDARRMDDGPIVACSGSRAHPDTVSHAWRDFLKANPNIRPLPFKNLRHTSLTLAYEASGGNIQATSRRGGHSSVAITSRFYVRESSAIDDAIGDAIDDII